MSVYFVTCREINMVKIGTTIDLDKRLVNLRCGSPLPLKLEAMTPGDHMREGYFHDIFKESWSHGEWFKITPDIEEVISEWPAEERIRPTSNKDRFTPPRFDNPVSRVRTKLQITQVRLAGLLGVTPQQMSAYERGKKPPPEIQRKLKALRLRRKVA